ncbi:MAG TPA: GAF domain-containing protein [Myxococcota bacterium]|nr:GAF domain-containing protein [Myxococcota bacterium]
MSSDRSDLLKQGEEFLQAFSRGAEFTKELLVENARLRERLAALEQEQADASRTPEEWERYRSGLQSRLDDLEQECASVRLRLQQVEEENQQFASRYLEVEEENNNLASLYVASYQLHSTLDLDEVLKIIVEIVINLVGADIFAVYLLDGNTGQLDIAASEGADPSAFPSCSKPGSPLSTALERGEVTCGDSSREPNFEEPIVCIPLIVHDRPIGLIGIFSLLQQKDGFSKLDHELFSVMGGHASTALFAARLYSQSERRLNTIQGFIDLLAK